VTRSFVQVNGITQPAPAPRFGGAPEPACARVRAAGADTRALLNELGYAPEAIARLLDVAAHQAA
jgi:alpha-methylacyl-CoA racemase